MESLLPVPSDLARLQANNRKPLRARVTFFPATLSDFRYPLLQLDYGTQHASSHNTLLGAFSKLLLLDLIFSRCTLLAGKLP